MEETILETKLIDNHDITKFSEETKKYIESKNWSDKLIKVNTDLIGIKFGKLLVLERFKDLIEGNTKHPRTGVIKTSYRSCWICRCDCGKEKISTGKTLLGGYSTNCGCSDPGDLLNKVYGKLKVIEELPKKSNRQWNCLCECGNQIVFSSLKLKKYPPEDCGCVLAKNSDLIGKVFNKLTVLKKSNKKYRYQKYWTCLCECGNTVEANESRLKLSDTKSCNKGQCGVLATEDLTGKRFGKLIVLSRNFDNLNKDGLSKSYKRSIRWNCICDCGNDKIVEVKALVNGSVQSCRCLWRVDPVISTKNYYYNVYKRSAKYMKVNFYLSLDYFISIVEQNCHYCGREPFKVINKYIKKDGKIVRGMEHATLEELRKFDYKCNGIDKKDPIVGYVEGNCLPCCYPCNIAKLDTNYDEHIKYLDLVADYRISLRTKEKKSE